METSKTKKKTKSLKERMKGKFSKESISQNLLLALQSIKYFFAFFGIGYHYCVTSLCLQLLKSNTNSTDSTIGLIITARGLGAIVGGLISGKVFDFVSHVEGTTRKWYKPSINHVLALACCILAAGLYAAPFISNIFILYFDYFFHGFGSSLLEIGCYIAIVQVWKKKVNIPQSLLIAFVGFNQILFPLIIGVVYKYCTTSASQSLASFFAAASGTLIPTVPLLLVGAIPTQEAPEPTINEIELHEKKKKETKEKTKFDSKPTIAYLKDIENITPNNEETEGNGTKMAIKNSFVKNIMNKIFKKKKKKKISWKELYKSIVVYSIIVLCGLLKCLFEGNRISFTSLLMSYCLRLKIGTTEEISLLSSSFFVGFTISRFVSGFLVGIIPPVVILGTCFIGAVVTFTVFIIFSEITMVVWICTIIFAVFSAPASSCALLLPQSAFGIKLLPRYTSIISLIQYFGEMLIPLLMSIISGDEVLGPKGMIVVSLSLLIISTIAFFITCVIGLYHKKILLTSKQATVHAEKINIQGLFDNDDKMRVQKLSRVLEYNNVISNFEPSSVTSIQNF